jgi:hypothetical protein
MWIACSGNQFNPIAYSTNGINWSLANTTAAPFYGCINAEFNGSYWVAIGYGVNVVAMIATSSDGITWTKSNDPSVSNVFSNNSSPLNSIMWNNSISKWIATGQFNNTGTTIATSPDGIVWTAVGNMTTSNFYVSDMAYNQTIIIAPGYSFPSGNFAINASATTTPSTWTIMPTVSNQTLSLGKTVVFNSALTRWVMGGSSTNQNALSYSSNNGTTWALSSITGTCNAVAST